MRKTILFPLLILTFVIIIVILFYNSQNNIEIEKDNVIINYNLPSDNPKQNNALDRVFNPLRYPFQSIPFYNKSWYPNYNLPANVIGCAGRRQPCLGGSQITIPNEHPSLNITNQNIAPINIRTRGPEGEPQQVGVIYKIFGNNNEIYPLFGRPKFPNDNRWEYYTIMGNFGSKIPLNRIRNDQELGSNEIITVKNIPGRYRTTIYEKDSPVYIPYA